MSSPFENYFSEGPSLRWDRKLHDSRWRLPICWWMSQPARRWAIEGNPQSVENLKVVRRRDECMLAAKDGFHAGQTAKARQGHRVQSLPPGTWPQALSRSS